jgi:hypothetical protein
MRPAPAALRVFFVIATAAIALSAAGCTATQLIRPRRWVFDLVLSNPDAVRLYRMSPGQYAAAVGCKH